MGMRVQHFSSERLGTVVALPSIDQPPQNQTHMLIKFDIPFPAHSGPSWRRIAAFVPEKTGRLEVEGGATRSSTAVVLLL